MVYIYFLIALVVALIVWYQFGCSDASENCARYTDETPTDSHTEDDGSCGGALTDKPADLLDAPRNGEKDNLTRIKGVGAKIEERINAAGIYHFDQIAAWTEENIAWADVHLRFRGRAVREEWVEQAKILAEGGETEFSKRVDNGDVATSKE